MQPHIAEYLDESENEAFGCPECGSCVWYVRLDRRIECEGCGASVDVFALYQRQSN